MKIELNPTFRFKGSRTYVHGTDLFNYAINVAKEHKLLPATKIDTTFHSIIKGQVDGYITDEDEQSQGSFQFKFNNAGRVYKLVLNEVSNPVLDRYEYAEEDIVRLSTIDSENQEITLNDAIEFSNIEKIVAMNKGLLESLFSDIPGKWYFSRIKLSENLTKEAYNKYSIRLVKNLNFKLTKSEIHIDNQLVGYIFFSLV